MSESKVLEPQDLLIELGSEELPPATLTQLSQAWQEALAEQFKQQGLAFTQITSFYTPRRLAVIVHQLAGHQEDQMIERRGPALTVAFDDEGNPSKALLGFCKSCGLTVEDLQKIETDKGTWLYAKSLRKGLALDDLIQDIIEKSLAALPIPRPMRWGTGEHEFIRPLHWLTLLYGERSLTCKIKGIDADCITYGHRFHAPAAIKLKSPADYESALAAAQVIASFEQRKQSILDQLKTISDDLGAILDYEDSLLEEVCNLVEYPNAIIGQFDAKFLDIPQEVLVVTMQESQRYFPLYRKDDKHLLPQFITIANIKSTRPEVIQQGNERVIRPRFEDAEFFWQRDKTQSLESRVDKLNGILFEKKLGSIADKGNRCAQIAAILATKFDINTKLAQRACMLCKCDLLTEMVTEFPKLQGIMGRYYAQHDGEEESLAVAIEEHYWPLKSGAVIPSSQLGQVVALADRIDSLLGIFASGKKPSGVKDPYALRRAALSLVRITIEGKLEFDLNHLLQQAAALLPKTLQNDQLVSDVEAFILDRMRGYLVEQGLNKDCFEAVLAGREILTDSTASLSLFDCYQRSLAVSGFRSMPEAASLTASNKRIGNILKKIDSSEVVALDAAALTSTIEQKLCTSLDQIETSVEAMVQQQQYTEALHTLAQLKEDIDHFFEEVMVMHEDPTIRANRIALVSRVHRLFTAVADIAVLQV